MANNNAAVSHLDRQITNTTTGVTASYNSGTNLTTWTLPYSVPTNGSGGTLAICRTDTNVWLGSVNDPASSVVSRPSANTIAVTGNLAAVPVLIGLLYAMTYELSTIYMRNQKMSVEQRGRLRLGYLNISYEPMTDMTITVTPQGRSAYTYVFNDPQAQTEDTPGQLEIKPFRVPIGCRNEDATIVITNATPGSTRIVAFDWEGNLNIRSRGV